MAFSRNALIALGALAMSLGGCDKVSGSWTSGNGSASASPSATPAQALAALPSPMAAGLDFGDDNGKYAKDGECDDPRFTGAGMTNTPLLDSDIRHDATDCRTAFAKGRLTVKQQGPTPQTPQSAKYDPDSAVGRIIWGDDNGKYARDGECDDQRFSGPGMTDTPLLESDIKHDATDCRVAFTQGRLTLRE